MLRSRRHVRFVLVVILGFRKLIRAQVSTVITGPETLNLKPVSGFDSGGSR